MRFHWSNENDKPGGRHGSPLRHGRAWLTLFNSREPQTREQEQRIKYRPGININWEWVLGKFALSASFGFCKSEDRGVSFSFAIPFLLTLYVTLAGGPFAWLAIAVLPKKWNFDTGENRTIGFYIHDWAIWWTVWRDRMASWSRAIPRWRQGSWHPLDTFLGLSKYSERPFYEGEIVVPMPERSYRGKIVLSEDSWKRPRWPFAQRLVRAKVDMLDGEQIPEPGKGENSYDCGEDAMYGWGGPCKSVSEAVGKIVESVTRTRSKRAGMDWKPEAVRKAMG
jgi:hypothetical protein